ncbi:hypothetical protein QA338_03585 [Glaesserella parasuis]|uniref:hypothetical protein n=1 Tax=Glaesserella parasuis TaxID=738 RepID=UPI002436DE95|nr:hypothetical protein [Glaesserella parasuis]MDG6345439.1 hypothetical protein [Glaesserella parasuis]MDG6771115.1 hypothetical protein [Glaesserella parasuis]
MRSSIPLSLTNKTLSAASGKTYHLVDKSGEPLKVFFTKIVDEQLVIYTEEPSISSEETPQAPELVIDDYQQASFVAPQDTVISGSGAALFETTSNIEPASDIPLSSETLPTAATNQNNSLLWWTLGGVSLLDGGVALVGSSSKSGKNNSHQEASPPPVQLEKVANNNVINFSESNQTTIEISGKLRQPLNENTELKLLLDGKPLETDISLSDTQFSAHINTQLFSQH